MQENKKVSYESFNRTKDTSEIKENPTQPKEKVAEGNEKEKEMAPPIVLKQKDPTTKLKEKAVPNPEAEKISTPQKESPDKPKSSSTIKKGTSKVDETKTTKGEDNKIAKPTGPARGPGGKFLKKQEEPTPESKEKPLPKTEDKKESEEKKEMSPTIEKEKKEEPTPELKAETVLETEAVKESRPRGEIPGIPISSYAITRGTAKVPEKKTAKEKEKEMAPPIEKEQKEEPTPELKAEPVLETEDVKKSEDKKDIPDIPEPSPPDIEKRAKEAEEEIGNVVKIVKTETGKVFVLVKNASDKLIKAIGKPKISDMMKKTAITSISTIKHPVNTASNFDKKVTKLMKRLTYFNIRNNSPNSKDYNSNSKNNKKMPVVIVLNADKRITKSVKDLFNSMI